MIMTLVNATMNKNNKTTTTTKQQGIPQPLCIM